jgi:tetratricopeptide (TPR) repeat protein
MCLKELGDFQASINMLDYIISLNPEMIDTYFHDKGDVSLAKGDTDGALHDYNVAIELNPYSNFSKAALVDVLDLQGKHMEAFQVASRFIDSIKNTSDEGAPPYCSLLLSKMKVLTDSYDYVRAWNVYESCFLLKSNYLDLYLGIGLRRTQGLPPIPLEIINGFCQFKKAIVEICAQTGDPQQRYALSINYMSLFEWLNRSTNGTNPHILDWGAFYFTFCLSDEKTGHDYGRAVLSMTPYVLFSAICCFLFEVSNKDTYDQTVYFANFLAQNLAINFQSGMHDIDLLWLLPNLIDISTIINDIRVFEAKEALLTAFKELNLDNCAFVDDETREAVEKLAKEWLGELTLTD